ncbi:MAG: hypothetical protein P8P91_20280 [Pseudomonadales bacterium]|nr:hypothetical protein [Pseudomonadales bacterium]
MTRTEQHCHLDRSERSERSGEIPERDFSIPASPPVEMTRTEQHRHLDRSDNNTVISTGVSAAKRTPSSRPE